MARTGEVENNFKLCSLLPDLPVFNEIPVFNSKKNPCYLGVHSTPRKVELWRFLFECLLDPTNTAITWIGYCGEFRINNPHHMAKMWGQVSGRYKMTYNTMSRALRHYYGKGILSKIKNKKWCYCFNTELVRDEVMKVMEDYRAMIPYEDHSMESAYIHCVNCAYDNELFQFQYY